MYIHILRKSDESRLRHYSERKDFLKRLLNSGTESITQYVTHSAPDCVTTDLRDSCQYFVFAERTKSQRNDA